MAGGGYFVDHSRLVPAQTLLPSRHPGRRATLAFAALAAGGAVAVLSRFDPRTTSFFPPCLFHRLTGCHCPGCGTTRALHALVHGDLLGALHDNAVLVLVLPAVVALLGAKVMLPPGHRPFVPVWLGWTLFAGLMLFTVARNVPVYPLTLLAPR